MRKYILKFLFCISTLILISWGFTGHRTVALLAERHLSLQAKTAIADLLDDQSLADVSTWADEVRNKPEYRNTSGWHFLNLPLGLNVDQFETQVKTQTQENVYSAFLMNERTLKRPSSTKEQKVEALKLIIHLVGDAHQPMHISRAEDKGGNTIQVQFDGKGTNLHSLWDSKLLDKQGMSDTQMATELDKATPAQIKQWQSENILYWIYESYQISSQLYSEVKSGSKLDETYYQMHIGTVNERIEKAGIRLAGVLNEVFKNYSVKDALKRVPAVTVDNDGSIAQMLEGNMTKGIVQQIDLNSVAQSVGKTVNVKGLIYGYRSMGSFILVNLGAAYPNQILTVVLRGEAMKAFKEDQNSVSKLNPDIKNTGRYLSVTGPVTLFKGKPQIEVRDNNMMQIEIIGGAE